ncbi:MAG: hypothetical protein EPO26_09990 [Chloroflexota bacterium]|nr:MAG: hypothetical protein EPO26_09990 [Chloroflexota bacterium]
MRTISQSSIWMLVFLCICAFALRSAFSHGDLWGDEAASVTMSLRPLGELLSILRTAEPHPPLFPLLLKGWIRGAGTEEFAVRLPSIYAGTLIVPVAAALGRRFNRGASLLAATMTAFSPFLIWYATEARMYAFATLFGTASWYWLVRLRGESGGSIRTGMFGQLISRRIHVFSGDRLSDTASGADRWRDGATYAAFITLALLSHYFTLFVAAAQALTLVAWWWRDRAPSAWAIVGLAVGGVLPAIWLLGARRIASDYYGPAPGSLDLPAILYRSWSHFAAGWSVPAEASIVYGTLSIVIGVYGMAHFVRARHAVLPVSLLAPIGLALAVSIARPIFQERYLGILAPSFLIATAAAATTSPLAFGIAVGASTLAAEAHGLLGLASGQFARSEYGQHARRLNALARPGDGVILTGTSQAPLYEYYASQDSAGLPVYGIPSVPRDTDGAIAAEVVRAASEHDVIWLFLYAESDYDPEGVVPRWLIANAFRGPEWWTVNGRLRAFAPVKRVSANEQQSTVRIAGTTVTARLPTTPILAGRFVPIEMTFSNRVFSAQRIRARLLDDDGMMWGEIDDGRSYSGETERLLIPLAGGAPPGHLRVDVALLAGEGSQASVIDHAMVGSVQVGSSDRFWSGDIDGFARSGARSGLWMLIGSANSPSATPGSHAYVTTVWRSEGSAAEDVETRIVDRDGRPIIERRSSLTVHAAGHIVRIQTALPIRTRVTPGQYRVQTRLANESAAAWIEAGQLSVAARQPVTSGESPSVMLNALFDGFARLRGITVEPHAGTILLYWDSLAETDRDWNVFVHALDRNGAIVDQSDGRPLDGTLPTDTWTAGDRIAERRRLPTVRGPVRLRIGLYDPRTGIRAHVDGPTDDAIVIDEVDFGD